MKYKKESNFKLYLSGSNVSTSSPQILDIWCKTYGWYTTLVPPLIYGKMFNEKKKREREKKKRKYKKYEPNILKGGHHLLLHNEELLELVSEVLMFH